MHQIFFYSLVINNYEMTLIFSSYHSSVVPKQKAKNIFNNFLQGTKADITILIYRQYANFSIYALNYKL